MPGITTHTIDALIEDIVDVTATGDHNPSIRAIPSPRTNGHVMPPSAVVRPSPFPGNAQASA